MLYIKMFTYCVFDDFSNDPHTVLVGVDAIGGVHVIEIVIEAAAVKVCYEEIIACVLDCGFDYLIKNLGALL